MQIDKGAVHSTRLLCSWYVAVCWHCNLVHTCRQGFEVKAQTLEEEHVVASGMVDRTKVNIEAKQRAEDDIRRDVELAKLGAENAMVERVSPFMKLGSASLYRTEFKYICLMK